jgi:hypothetical protein
MLPKHTLLGFHRSCLTALVAAIPCSPTCAQPSESTPVYRVQLAVTVANIGNAGTNDPVSASLNAGNLTWMDYSRNDFQKGSTNVYDLQQTQVTTLANIQQLQLTKTGSDGLCVASVTLTVNNVVIFAKSLGSPCLWLDDSSGRQLTTTITSSELRSHAQWIAFSAPAFPLRITQAEFESRIESQVGHAMNGNPMYWGHLHGRGVEVTRKSADTLAVDLDLAVDIPGPDPEVDVDFTLRVTCLCQIRFTSGNRTVKIDSKSPLAVLAPALVELTERGLSQMFERSFRAPTVAGGTVPACPTLTIVAPADLTATLPPLLPDLVAMGTPSPNPDVFRPGETFSHTWTVINNGAAAAGAFGVSFLLSDLPVGQIVNPVNLATRNYPSLGVCRTVGRTETLTIPAASSCGHRILYTVADANSTVAEVNEGTNNTLPRYIRVGSADVRLFGAFNVPKPPSIIGVPWTERAGSPMLFPDDWIQNTGLLPAPQFSYGLYLSTDATITAADILIDQQQVGPIAPGGLAHWGGTVVTIPVSVQPGNYYFGIMLDDTNVMSECNEADNTAIEPITITPGRPSALR